MDHREMRRKDKEVTDHKWMEEILKRGKVLHLGLAELAPKDGWPYVVTMCYGWRDGVIYVHGAPVGKVCFQVVLDVEVAPNEIAAKFSMKYRSVVGFGRLSTVTDPDERLKGLNVVMDQYAGPHVDVKDVNERVWVARIDIDRMTGKRSVYTD